MYVCKLALSAPKATFRIKLANQRAGLIKACYCRCGQVNVRRNETTNDGFSVKTPKDIAQALIEPIQNASGRARRKVVAVAGPPASGKSTISTEIAALLDANGHTSQVVPMDGYHLDNEILIARGLLHRKGAPETFDAIGFSELVSKLAVDEQVDYPTFDRRLDASIPNGGSVLAECDIVLVEGNYLLFDAPVWRDLVDKWDFTVWLDVPEMELRARLVQRWLDNGLDRQQAIARAEENDLANALTVNRAKFDADITVSVV